MEFKMLFFQLERPITLKRVQSLLALPERTKKKKKNKKNKITGNTCQLHHWRVMVYRRELQHRVNPLMTVGSEMNMKSKL